MKLLLDENIPHEFRSLLMPPHDVFTVAYMGWVGLDNGKLLTAAAADGFAALVTTDRGYEHQQHLPTLPCSVVLLLSPSNRIDDLRPLVPALLAALSTITPKSLVKVR